MRLSAHAVAVAVLVSSLGFDARAQADVKLFPVAAPAYTPEQGLLIAGGGVMTWNGDVMHPELPRSTMTLVVGASTSGSMMLQSRLTAYTLGDSLRFMVPVDARDQPDHYFGKGFEQATHRPLGADTTALRRTWWFAEPTLLRQLRGALYGGALVQFSGTLSRDESPGVRADSDFRRHGSRIINTGVGLTLQYDTRDVPIDAYRGTFLSATWVAFGHALSADTEWHAVQLDYRQYVTILRAGSTLAWQVKYRTTLGEVPWSELSMVGTPWDLRAYRWGQYRDRTALTLVLEYRFMLPFAAETLWSHLGAAAWVGVGALGATPSPDFTRLLPAAGVGLRVELLKRVTLRLDVGFGRDARAVYFNFLEAF